MQGAIIALVPCLLAGCQNSLPGSGDCTAFGEASDRTIEGTPIALVGQARPFDDLRFAPAMGVVLAVPQGSGTLFVVDVETLEVARFDGIPSNSASADANERFIFVVDRSADTVVVVDPIDGSFPATIELAGASDYVRVAPSGEIWVTEAGQIEILSLMSDPPALASVAVIELPSGPEGLAFDASRGLAFVQGGGGIVVIDADERRVIDEWDAGCTSSHGMPVVDEERGFVFAGCRDAGGGAVLSLDDGAALAGYEVGGGEAVLAYAPAMGHFYLRSDPGAEVAVLGVCDDGQMIRLGTALASDSGHALAADDRGGLWAADAQTGDLIRFDDSFALAE